MVARHRGTDLVPWWVFGLVVVLAGTFFFAGLCLAVLRDEPTRLVPGRTVTVPGPTVTISYLIERTVTPGVDGY